MTGYGFAETQHDGTCVTVEISSVNKKGLDLNVNLPRHLISMEIDLRKMISKEITRGRIVANINLTRVEKALKLQIHEDTLVMHHQKLSKLAKKIGCSNEMTLPFLLTLPGVLESGRDDTLSAEMKRIILTTAEQALAQLLKARQREGTFLCHELLSMFKKMEPLVKKIEGANPEVIKRYRKNLEERMQDAEALLHIDEDRMLKEIALFADRADITEEITRLKAHIKEAKHLLSTNEPVGRNMDFLLQEINREINTIGSKANGLEISKHVITLKTELEKVREQVQNLE